MVEIFFAFALDLTLGDPVYSWHPIRLLGFGVEKTERWFRSWMARERLAGLFQALLIPAVTFGIVWALCQMALRLHPVMEKIVSIYFIYSSIAMKDLKDEARKVFISVRKEKYEEARENLSRIVGRDTENLSKEEIIRATVETVAESFLDGVLAPLFYTALGGAPLVMAYKAINTLDSMVGLRTPRYREFGWAAAKLDEIANWIPARLSWLLIGLATLFVNGRCMEAWWVGLEDGVTASGPNGMAPEAAFAGALGVELGGINFYEGQPVEMPKMGYPIRPLELDDIRRAWRLMIFSSWATLVFAVLLRYFIS